MNGVSLRFCLRKPENAHFRQGNWRKASVVNLLDWQWPRRSKLWQRPGSIRASSERFGRAEESRSETIGYEAMRYSCRRPPSRSTLSTGAQSSKRLLADLRDGVPGGQSQSEVVRPCSARRTRRAPTRDDARCGSTTSRDTRSSRSEKSLGVRLGSGTRTGVMMTRTQSMSSPHRKARRASYRGHG